MIASEEAPRSISVNSSGALAADRRFIVPTADPLVALTADGIPAKRSTYPGNDRLLLDDYQLTTDGGSTTVTARYSSDGKFVAPPRVTTTEGYQKWGVSRAVKVTTKLVSNTRSTKTSPRSNNRPPEIVEVWEAKEFPLEEQRYIYPIQIYCKVDDVSRFDIARRMEGTYHRANGVTMRFLGLTQYTEKGDGWYLLTYEWEKDDGTLRESLGSTPRVLFLDPTNRTVHPTLYRLPFESHYKLDSIDVENSPHDVFALNPVPTDNAILRSWTQLPGEPRLEY